MPKEEAEQVVAFYKEIGKTVGAHFYAHEGHGFVKRENQIDAIKRTVAWFDQYLKNRPWPNCRALALEIEGGRGSR